MAVFKDSKVSSIRKNHKLFKEDFIFEKFLNVEFKNGHGYIFIILLWILKNHFCSFLNVPIFLLTPLTIVSKYRFRNFYENFFNETSRLTICSRIYEDIFRLNGRSWQNLLNYRKIISGKNKILFSYQNFIDKL